MEVALEQSRSDATKRRKADIETMMNKLFVNDRPLTADAVARVLREERFSEEQLVLLLEALWKTQKQAAGASSPNTQGKTPGNIQIINTTTHTVVDVAMNKNQTEFELLGAYMQVLLDAAAVLDDEQQQQVAGNTSDNRRWSGRVASQLRSRLKEWNRASEEDFKRRFVTDLSSAIQIQRNSDGIHEKDFGV